MSEIQATWNKNNNEFVQEYSSGIKEIHDKYQEVQITLNKTHNIQLEQTEKAQDITNKLNEIGTTYKNSIDELTNKLNEIETIYKKSIDELATNFNVDTQQQIQENNVEIFNKINTEHKILSDTYTNDIVKIGEYTAQCIKCLQNSEQIYEKLSAENTEKYELLKLNFKETLQNTQDTMNDQCQTIIADIKTRLDQISDTESRYINNISILQNDMEQTIDNASQFNKYYQSTKKYAESVESKMKDLTNHRQRIKSLEATNLLQFIPTNEDNTFTVNGGENNNQQAIQEFIKIFTRLDNIEQTDFNIIVKQVDSQYNTPTNDIVLDTIHMWKMIKKLAIDMVYLQNQINSG